MKIILFDKTYYSEVIELFIKEYSEPGTIREWNYETTKAYLDFNNSEFSFISMNEDSILTGGIFARLMPYYSSQILFIDSIQVPTQSKVTEIAGDPIAGDHLEDGYAGDFHNSITGITSRWVNINGSLKSIQY